MTRKTKEVLVMGIIIVVVGLFIKFAPKYLAVMNPAPPGIHGLYSRAEDPIYKTKLDKDTFLHSLQQDGFIVERGRLHDYDPPWDSLRYVIDNITCDTQKIKPYIEFRKEKQNGFTTFRILWINASPNESYDTTLYRQLAEQYYNCFEVILKRHHVQ